MKNVGLKAGAIVLCMLMVATSFAVLVNAQKQTKAESDDTLSHILCDFGKTAQKSISGKDKSDSSLLFDDKNQLVRDFTQSPSLQEKSQDKPTFESGEILIKFKCDKNDDFDKEQTLSAVDRILAKDPSFSPVLEKKPVFTVSAMDKERTQKFGIDRWFKFTLSEDADISQEIMKYKSNPSLQNIIEEIQPNYIMTTCLEPNDPYYHSSGSWGQSFPDLWGLHKIDAEGAWDVTTGAWEEITTGSHDVVVAVVDTGVDYLHEDIGQNMWINKDDPPNGIDDDHDGFIDNKYGADFAYNDGDPMDGHGHGTHCAGTIAAMGNNSFGVVGMNWHCQIMAVKGLDDSGSGWSDTLASALRWAVDNGANVVSNSWGTPYREPSDPIIENAIRYVYDCGCTVVFAAGNSNDDVKYYSPNNMDEVINVAATDYLDRRASFSNFGDLVSVCAPGVDILSLRARDTDMYGDGRHIVDDIYYYSSGTSMACPHVAGLAALLLAKNHGLTPDMIKTMLTGAVDEIDSEVHIGGRINASKALSIRPAIVKLYPFTNDGEVIGTVNISGTAWGEEFLYYVVECGQGINPTSWTEIVNSTTTITDGVLATFNTDSYTDGYYSIRLRVVCSDMTYTLNAGFRINNEYNLFYVDANNIEGPWEGTFEHPFLHIYESTLGAGNGDDIHVRNGVYSDESFILDRAVDLTGEDKNYTIIESTAYDTICSIFCRTNISGFTFRSQSGTSGQFGLRILSSNNNISGNNFQNLGIGISVEGDVVDNVFIENNFINNSHGIAYFDIFSSMSDTIISKNIFTGNILDGMYLASCENNTVTWNTFTNNSQGLILKYSKNINISNNEFFSDGIHFLSGNWNGHTILNNHVNGKPIYYYANMHNLSVVPPGAGQIILANCQNSIIKDYTISNVNNGIQIGFCSNISIVNTTVSGNNVGGGISLLASSNTRIENCTSYSTQQIQIQGASGFEIYSHDTRFINCTAYNNDVGFYCSRGNLNTFFNCTSMYNDNSGFGLDYGSSYNTFVNCTTKYNPVGFDIGCGFPEASSCDNNIITNNTIHDNGDGIRIQWSDNNKIYYNDFVNIYQNAFEQCYFGNHNMWYNEELQRGNWWSDYDGFDENPKDGIGDTPYDISGGFNQDLYPLGYFKIILPLVAEANVPYTGFIGMPVSFSGSATGGIQPYNYVWDFGDGNNSPLQNPTYRYDRSGIYTVTFTVIDRVGNITNDTHCITINSFQPYVQIDDDYNENTPGFGVDHFNQIKDGVSAVGNQGTVFVFSGIYHEQVMIEKPISLIGENQQSTIIDSSQEGYGVFINADHVHLSGFTIQHSGGEYQEAGLAVVSQYSTICDNTIIHDLIGIELNGQYNTFLGNTIDLNNVGLAGIYLLFSSNNTISNNIVKRSTWLGILLDSSTNNSFYENDISDNLLGLATSIEGKSKVMLGGKNGGGFPESVPSDNNTLYHNNFVNNAQNVYDPYDNSWYNTARGEGNYWSDFDESSEGAYDNDSDGIVDSSYAIIGGNNQDLYPLMHLFVLGDMNHDGCVNWRDVDPFVLAMSDPAAYQNQYHILPKLHGDINQDGVVNWRDIEPFVALLTG